MRSCILTRSQLCAFDDASLCVALLRGVVLERSTDRDRGAPSKTEEGR